MQSPEEQNFCTQCGETLKSSDRYCPSCGARVPGRNPEKVAEEREEVKKAVGYQLKWAAALMLIYSIPFLIIGIVLLINMDTIAHELITDPNFQSIIEQYGLVEAEIDEYVEYMGVAFVLSSCFGIISSVLCIRRRCFWGALILCILSLFTGAGGLFSLFLGIFAFWMILVGKMGFKEYAADLDEQLEQIQ